MKNLENNKLIAEFMGLDELGRYVPTKLLPSIKYGLFQGIFEIEETEFHISWDWLMPVVDKIEKLNFEINGVVSSVDINIIYGDCIIQDEDGLGELYIYKHSNESGNKLESVYRAVVEFIKWYNKNKEQ